MKIEYSELKIYLLPHEVKALSDIVEVMRVYKMHNPNTTFGLTATELQAVNDFIREWQERGY